MKTIKIIDLLNMISKGEEVPKKIKFDNTYWNRICGEKYPYYTNDYDSNLFIYFFRKNLTFSLNDEVEIIEENKKELHANNTEFNIYDDKKEFIITLDENDLGIDKLHLDNCYFYKENDKWYVKHINLKPIAYISQEHKIPEKINYKYKNMYGNISQHKQSEIDIIDKINEILDYLEEIE